MVSDCFFVTNEDSAKIASDQYEDCSCVVGTIVRFFEPADTQDYTCDKLSGNNCAHEHEIDEGCAHDMHHLG